MPKTKKELSQKQLEKLFSILKTRFEKNPDRHKGIEWDEVQKKFQNKDEKIWALYEMERTGGEPDVVLLSTSSSPTSPRLRRTRNYFFIDCSEESPKGRRNICYDREGQKAREKQGIYPKGNAVDMADAMGIEILTEKEYRQLQELAPSGGGFDCKTSSWIKTSPDIRKLGGALFADRRYDHVFVYHNSAPTFYRVRGFRGILRI